MHKHPKNIASYPQRWQESQLHYKITLQRPLIHPFTHQWEPFSIKCLAQGHSDRRLYRQSFGHWTILPTEAQSPPNESLHATWHLSLCKCASCKQQQIEAKTRRSFRRSRVFLVVEQLFLQKRCVCVYRKVSYTRITINVKITIFYLLMN